jgi:hypothetical protein
MISSQTVSFRAINLQLLTRNPASKTGNQMGARFMTEGLQKQGAASLQKGKPATGEALSFRCLTGPAGAR